MTWLLHQARRSKLHPAICRECGERGKPINWDSILDRLVRRYECKKLHRWSTEEMLIQPGRSDRSLQARMRRHIETCSVCTPLKACPELLILHKAFLQQDIKMHPDAFTNKGDDSSS